MHFPKVERFRGKTLPAFPDPAPANPDGALEPLGSLSHPAPPRPAFVFPALSPRLQEVGVARRKFSRYGKVGISGSGVMAASFGEGAPAEADEKRQQFGSRFLSDPARVFHHNAW